MYTLNKNFRFESAHRLAKGYEGKCRNIHGHSWNGSIYVKTPNLDQYDFAVDYSILGEFTKALEETLDHKIILWVGDTSTVNFCASQGYQMVVLDDNPTCEIISEYIFKWAEKWFFDKGYKFEVAKVEIKETCTTGCVYEG